MIDDWGLSGFRRGGLGQVPATAPTQYGVGPTYQANCPLDQGPPAGYVAWSVDENGPIPADVQTHVTALANDMTKPLGYTDTIYSGGVPLLVRVSPHTWTTGTGGNLVAACMHGAELFVPLPGTPAPPTTTTAGLSASTTSTLFVASLAMGAVVSALTIWDFLQKRRR